MAKPAPYFDPRLDSTPMSASEGGLFLLGGAALVGLGYIAGRFAGWRAEVERERSSPRYRPRRPHNPQSQSQN